MKKLIAVLVFFLAISAIALTDDEIKQEIIQQSIANYPGNCPCPYSTMRSGRAHGDRSAYSRTGGYETICYTSDVTTAMVRAYRGR